MVTNPNDQRSVSGASESTFPSSDPDLARVFVRLTNGTKIVVPVPQNSTVQVLHVQALRRAERFGIRGTLDNTTLKTTGHNHVALFGEDSLADVLDLTKDNTFSLGFLGGSASQDGPLDAGIPCNVTSSGSNLPQGGPPVVSNEGSSSIRADSEVYIRWITLEAALENHRLRRIPADRSPIARNTTLNGLHRIAVERLCGSSPQGSCINPQRLNLFVRECRLHTDTNPATLNDLGMKGSRSKPLDIFVEFIGPENRASLNQLSLSSEPKHLWSFDSTKRGISTFITSLQILFQEIERGHCTLDGILEVLLELTHFPPLLLALKTIHEFGLECGTAAGPVLLVASAFHALCCKMAPRAMCSSSENALETSRQVMWWIYTLRSEAFLARGKNQQLVHRAQIQRARGDSPSGPAFQPFIEALMPSASGTNSGPQKFLVSIEEGGNALCQLLGLALHDNAPSPWDFYFKAANGWEELWDHRTLPALHPNEFENLIENTNSMGAFRMVGPLQLGACLAAELPVITLSANGFVSEYNHEDLECSERRFITWNAIEKRVTLPDNSGQFLSQKLDPILTERKKNRDWEVDAWAERTKTADFGEPDEAIVICVDTSSSMSNCMSRGWIPGQDSLGTSPSRLLEVKEFFTNLVLRISALNLSTHLGLVTFSDRDRVVVKQPLTPLHLNFSHQLNSISASGSTAIFDALIRASTMLTMVKENYPQTKCRIILLTDGEDNRSLTIPSTVSSNLFSNNIVLDAVVIGSNETMELFKIARNTGGYAFAPQTQQALFQIFLLETVVDIRTRPDIVKFPVSGLWENFQPKAADMADPYDFPRCRPHPNLDDYFIALSDAGRFMGRQSRRLDRSSTSVHSASTRLSRATTMTGMTGTTVGAGGNSHILLSEIKITIDNPHAYMDIYVSQSNMGFWKVVMQGPPDSPYANGTFLLYIEIGSEFPRRPPSARFITPMLHPNITKHGRVCHPIFDREWTPTTRMYQVLQHLYGILMSLEARDAVDPLAALRFWSDEQAGRREVEKYVNRFAYRSRTLHRNDIIGDGHSSIASSVCSYASSNASSASNASDATVTSPRPPPSASDASIRSGSGSSLSSHLAAQRRPPPLMATNSGEVGANAGSGTRSAISQIGSDGRRRLTKTSSLSSSGSLVSETGSVIGSEAGSQGGRRLSRRASFFARLRGISGN